MGALHRPNSKDWASGIALFVLVLPPAPSVWPSPRLDPEMQIELKQTYYYVTVSEGEATNPQTAGPAAEALDDAILLQPLLSERVRTTPETAFKFTPKDCPQSSCEVVTEEVKRDGTNLRFILHVKLVKPERIQHTIPDGENYWECPVGGDNKEPTCWKFAPKHLAQLLSNHDEKVHQGIQGNQ
jgi:hypothetical protein